jgi:hypothetical protein
METPTDVLSFNQASVFRVSRVQRPRAVKTGGVKGSKGSAFLSRLAQAMAWHAFLKPGFSAALADRPDLVILFNDAAHPYDRLCSLLRDLEIPFVLVQEGIRYEVAGSAQTGSLNQGKGGAAAIAAWGKGSAEYFRAQGAPPETIHLTGNPRFDRIGVEDHRSEAVALADRLGLAGRNLLFLSNPIEFHGYCASDQKLELVRKFIIGLEPLFNDADFRLVLKLHSHENADDFLQAAQASKHASQVVIATDCHLYTLLSIANGAVIFSSTAGLEAMLFEVPVGVLEIPGVGFLHDYVSEGAAVPLRWSEPISSQVEVLLGSKGHTNPSVEKYLDRNLALRRGACNRVVDLVENVLRNLASGSTTTRKRAALLQ